MDRRIAHSRPFLALATNSTPAAEPPASSGATTVKGPAASEALVNQIEHVAGSVGWRAIVFHLSRLQRAHRAEKHLLIAANMLEDIVRQHFGRLFLLPNNDLVAVCKGIKAKTIQDAEETLRYLFNDDSFTRRTHDGAGFSSNFDLEREHVPCLAAIRKRSDAARPDNARCCVRPEALRAAGERARGCGNRACARRRASERRQSRRSLAHAAPADRMEDERREHPRAALRGNLHIDKGAARGDRIGVQSG